MLDKRSVLASKDEATYNTDSVPTAAANAVLIEDLQWAFASQRMYQRNPVRSSLALLKPEYAGALITISGKTEIKGSGTAGTAPEIAPLLRGCGFKETIVASTSVTYKLSSVAVDQKSQSQYFFDDGLRIILTGARGKPSFDVSVGKAGMVSWEFTGHFVSIADVALPAATYLSNVPPMLVNVPFTISGFAATIAKLAFDAGIELSTPDSISAVDGYGEVTISGRKLTGSFDPLRVAISTKDFIAQWRSGAVLALDTGVIGATAGNRYQITMPAVTYTDVKRGNRNNVGTYEIPFQAAETATGDDDLSLVFT
jgi:hypothetical protein